MKYTQDSRSYLLIKLHLGRYPIHYRTLPVDYFNDEPSIYQFIRESSSDAWVNTFDKLLAPMHILIPFRSPLCDDGDEFVLEGSLVE